MQSRAVIGEAMQLLQSGRADAALDKLRRAIARAPADLEVLHAMGQILLATGNPDQAAYHFERAFKASPSRADFAFGLGAALFTAGKLEAAARALKDTVRLNPNLAGAWVSLAAVLPQMGEPDGGLEAGRRGAELLPDEPTALENLGRAAGRCGLAEEALAAASRLAAIAPRNWTTRSFHLMLINYPSSVTEESVQAAHHSVGRELRSALGPLRGDDAFSCSRDPERPLRVGFLSSDLYRHSVAAFLEAALRHLPRPSFHITCYSTSHHEDDFTSRLRATSDVWVNVAGKPDGEVDSRIRADAIDVLIDLNGHSAGASAAVLARRPAPVVGTYIGYANTTAIDTVHFRIVDEVTDPPELNKYATESLVRLPRCFLCYTPDPEAPEPRHQSRQSPTFGSFNTALKISDRTIELWSQLLKFQPDARLLLKAPSFPARAAVERFIGAFGRQGVDPARIECLPQTRTAREHLDQYALVDVALDPVPYNGTTTTCEALWMGVPVVTLGGECHRARVGMSLLQAAGCPEWVARDEADFVRIGASLATQRPDRLALRERVRNSALCDGPAYGAALGAALRHVWKGFCNRTLK